jgi:1-acyl-sn-glycerol-3-phosphate acyltransferase
MTKYLRLAFFAVIVRPLVLLVLGMNVRGRENLPTKGPAIILANHNSHLDTLALMSLFPLSSLPQLKPVAALDYFLKSKPLAWFALNIIGILPIKRGGGGNPLAGSIEALKDGDILILFPEGSRGKPEEMSEFKRGAELLCKLNPDVPVYPGFLHGLGKALPKGSWLLVPFILDIFIGEPFTYDEVGKSFMQRLQDDVQSLADQGNFPAWD